MKKYLKQLKANKKGFTLIEMIVVIAIIGILAAILVPSMAGYLSTARNSKKEANAKTIYTAAQSAVTSLEATERLANGTYTKVGNDTPTFVATRSGTLTLTEESTPTPTQAEKLFNKIQDLIGASNYAKFSKIIVKVTDGAVDSVEVTETGEATATTYPKS